MCSHDLPDMYALSPRACGPWALGIHIRQVPRAHVTTITYTHTRISTHTCTHVPYVNSMHLHVYEHI